MLEHNFEGLGTVNCLRCCTRDIFRCDILRRGIEDPQADCLLRIHPGQRSIGRRGQVGEGMAQAEATGEPCRSSSTMNAYKFGTRASECCPKPRGHRFGDDWGTTVGTDLPS